MKYEINSPGVEEAFQEIDLKFHDYSQLRNEL